MTKNKNLDNCFEGLFSLGPHGEPCRLSGCPFRDALGDFTGRFIAQTLFFLHFFSDRNRRLAPQNQTLKSSHYQTCLLKRVAQPLHEGADRRIGFIKILQHDEPSETPRNSKKRSQTQREVGKVVRWLRGSFSPGNNIFVHS